MQPSNGALKGFTVHKNPMCGQVNHAGRTQTSSVGGAIRLFCKIRIDLLEDGLHESVPSRCACIDVSVSDIDKKDDSLIPGAPNCFLPRIPCPMTCAAVFASSGPAEPSTRVSSWSEIPSNQACADMVAGTEDNKLVAVATASWVIFAPRLSGSFDSGSLPALLGCTEKTNSSVARTPCGRSGRRVSVLNKASLSHGSTTPGLIRALRAGIRARTAELGFVSAPAAYW